MACLSLGYRLNDSWQRQSNELAANERSWAPHSFNKIVIDLPSERTLETRCRRGHGLYINGLLASSEWRVATRQVTSLQDDDEIFIRVSCWAGHSSTSSFEIFNVLYICVCVCICIYLSNARIWCMHLSHTISFISPFFLPNAWSQAHQIIETLEWILFGA